MKLFLDSCVVIYLVEQVEPWWERIDDALSEAVFDRLVISDLVRMECLVGPYRVETRRRRTLSCSTLRAANMHQSMPQYSTSRPGYGPAMA